MEDRCAFCERGLDALSVGAVVVTGDVEAPDPVVLCRRCAALPPHQRKTLRDAAMRRALLRDE